MRATFVDVENEFGELEEEVVRLASEVDRAPLIHADGWHTALLRRMAHPFPDVRKAVISDDCYKQLDRLRAFRYRERNTYGAHLDFDIVVERSREAVAAFDLFRHEVRAFFADTQTVGHNDRATEPGNDASPD